MSKPEEPKKKPQKPVDAERDPDAALSEEDLEEVAGGTGTGYYVKKHIGNVKYNDVSLDPGVSPSVTTPTTRKP